MPLSSASRCAGPPVYLGAMDDPQMYRPAVPPPPAEVTEPEPEPAGAAGHNAGNGCRRTPPCAAREAGPLPRPHG